MKRDYLEKSLKQFESHPYPNIPIEESPKDNVKLLYEGSLVTARYRRDGKVITDLENRVMLDVACGTGATTLTMALANPGAKVVGIDISPESIKIAEERLQYHKIDNSEFHVLALEDLDQLGQKFDYISASDILYLLPDLTLALQQLRAILKPDGIIRGNLHSYYQRLPYYRCQELFGNMGLMDDNPEEMELGIVRDFFTALRDNVDLKVRAWGNNFDKNDNHRLLSNHLLQNDKGFTMPQLLKCLTQSSLELISMVDWQDWDWRQLFKEPDNLPAYLAMGLENADLEEELCFYELIQPNKRLLDFWCGHPQPESALPILDWSEVASERLWVHFHPCLKSESFHEQLTIPGVVAPMDLRRFFPFLQESIWSDRRSAIAMFLSLWDGAKPLSFLLERWLQVSPVDAVTLGPNDSQREESALGGALVMYEELGLLMLEER